MRCSVSLILKPLYFEFDEDLKHSFVPFREIYKIPEIWPIRGEKWETLWQRSSKNGLIKFRLITL